MNKHLLIIIGLLLSSLSLFAQAPDSFNYQALIKDSDGKALINSEVNLKIEVISGTATGEVVYAESHLTNTDSNGIIHLKIGQGQIISGEFSKIKWGESNHFTQSYIDTEGGNNFETIAVSQLLSVPYALHANTSNLFSGDSLLLEGKGLNKDLIHIKNNDYSRISSYTANNGNDPTSVFLGKRSGGTLDEPLNISPNNRITGLYGSSYYNGDFEVNAAVEMIAGQQAGSNGVSSYIRFGTTNIGSLLRTEKMRISENGNVGIGNNSPQRILDVSLPTNGNEQNNGISLNRNNGYLNLVNGTMYQGHFQARISAQSTHDDSPGLVIAATPNSDIANSNAILLRGGEFNSLVNSDVLRVQNNLYNLMTVKSNGNVGIGNSNPNYKLDVQGTVNASEFLLNGEALGPFSIGSNLTIEGEGTDVDLITLKNNNFSRISSYTASNANDPTSVFVGFRSRGSNEQPLNIAPNNRITGLYGGSYYNGDFEVNAAVEMIAGELAGSNGVSSYIKFGTTNIGSIIRTEKMRIAENGNVGIGTQSPSSKLQVSNGDIYIENANNGVIMTSPDGNCWRMTVGNDGNPAFTSVTCPQ